MTKRQTLVVRAKTIVTCDTNAPQNGITFEALGRIDDAALVVEGGKVVEIIPSLKVTGGRR